MKCTEVDTRACFKRCINALAHRGAIYFCPNFLLGLVIHSCLFFSPKVAVKIIDKTQLNPTSLQKVRIDHNI